MFMKHSISTFACALALGLATGGYADDIKSSSLGVSRNVAAYPVLSSLRLVDDIQAKPYAISSRSLPMTAAYPQGFRPALPAPALLTTRDVFHTAAPVVLAPQKYRAESASNFRSLAITNAAFYKNLGGGFYDSTNPDSLDDVYLPVGIASGAGVTLTGFTISGRNIGATMQDLHGLLTIYDKIDTTQPANVASTPLASYQYTVTGVPANTSFSAGPYVLPATVTGPTLTHDLGTTGSGVYGVSIGYYTDTSYTTLSTTAVCRFAYGFQTQIGLSRDLFYPDIALNGTYQTGRTGPYYYGGAPYYANLQMELDGTSANNVTYDVAGKLTFTGLPAGTAPIPVVITLTSTTATSRPLVFSFNLTVGNVLDSNGNVIAQAGSYTLIGIPSDTYNIDIKPANYTAQDLLAQNVTVANLYGADATFAQPSTVTGTIGLEGVTDFSLVSPNSPVGPFTIDFYAPGAVAYQNGATPLYTQTVATLTPTANPAVDSYTVTGVPFGTYDVVVKSPKNLAVKDANVVLANATGDTIPLVILPAGDTNNDDSVDSSDFGNLIGVFGADSNITGSGYVAAFDLNYDGIIDSSDFGLLIGEFNNVGAK